MASLYYRLNDLQWAADSLLGPRCYDSSGSVGVLTAEMKVLDLAQTHKMGILSMRNGAASRVILLRYHQSAMVLQ